MSFLFCVCRAEDGPALQPASILCCVGATRPTCVSYLVAQYTHDAFIRCHTLEPPTQDEDWMPPITDDDKSVGEGEGAEDDAEAADGEEEKAPPKPLPCVELFP